MYVIFVFAIYFVWFFVLQCVCNYSCTEEEVDGNTLLKLTENMVEKLLPKMKLQVKFIELQKTLVVPVPQPIALASSSTATLAATAVDIRPMAEEQNG
jgi:hypothetical protein